MRIAILNSSGRKVGGIETYLNALIPALQRTNVQVALWHENDEPSSRDQIASDEEIPKWCVAKLGAESALAELRRWSPDVIYAHGLDDPLLEASTLEVAPAVFFAHAYYGTCISGSKSWSNGTVRPCNRVFGPRCLGHYYPHRCGGLNPITMLKEYQRQKLRLDLLPRYRCVLTGSEHMRAEYSKYGLRVQHLPLLVPPAGTSRHWTDSSPGWKLLFMGRMDHLKGGLTLIESLPEISAALDRPVHVTFAGDGHDRRLWESRAAALEASCAGLSFDFPGWVEGEAHDALIAGSDLLVMPSLWPEPFGLIGPQAGLRGLPAVAFAVGGTSDWLKDGVNGYLAPANPPAARLLAEAIIKCLRDSPHYKQLRKGALMVAESFSVNDHVSRVIKVLEQAVVAG
jgi:glycosyltransferase involved in cell wall biosynthesis